MSSKIITLRLPRTSYDALATGAAVAGLPLSVYVRGKLDRAELSATLETLVSEVRKSTSTAAAAPPPPPNEREILLLLRTLAAHVNPQIPVAVAAKLRAETQGKK